MEILSSSPEKTKELAQRVAKKLKPKGVLALYGDLGSGKTTFVRFLVEALGIVARVQSPSFILVRKYTGGSGSIKVVNHIDLYRLTSKDEVAELEVEELFNEEGSITVIEWPKLLEDFLPKDTVKIDFEYVAQFKRKINVQNFD